MKDTLHYIRTLCRFVLLGLLVGLVCGAVGTVFYHAIALATRLRTGHPWLLYLLPVAGLLTAYLYALLKMEKDPGTDAVLRATKDAQTVPARLAALICAMWDSGIEPKRLRLFCRSESAPPSLVLLEGRRGGREGMEILHKLAGYSMERADLVLRAIGKKRPDVLKMQREIFVYGSNRKDRLPQARDRRRNRQRRV